MSGPTVASASTQLLTRLLDVEVPQAVIGFAAALAGRLASTGVSTIARPLFDALLGEAVAAAAPGQATVLATGGRTAVPLAATMNAVAAEPAPDDEIFLPAFAASFATAEHQRVPATRWLAAFAVGAEVSARLGRAFQNGKVRAYIPASAVGQIGATLAVCRVLGADATLAAPAMGLAAIQVAGTSLVAMEHLLAIGYAARVAVEMAYLARFGASGPLNAVEAAGLMIAAPRLADQLDGLGETWITVGDSPQNIDKRLAALLP